MALHVPLCWFTVALFPLILSYLCSGLFPPRRTAGAQCLISLPKSSNVLPQFLALHPFTLSWPFISVSRLVIVLRLIFHSFQLKSTLFLPHHPNAISSNMDNWGEIVFQASVPLCYWKTTTCPLKQDHIFRSQTQIPPVWDTVFLNLHRFS